MASTSYPSVVRTVDPLVIRIEPLSLLVGDTNFYAKIKNGVAFTGFTIYASGLGTPIYEQAVSGTNTKTISGGTVVAVSNSEVVSNLTNAAKAWLDALEDSFSNIETENTIKSAIDRLCWQLHYDLTHTSTTTLPTGMDNITIDKDGVGNGTVRDVVTQLNENLTSTDSTTPGAIIKVARNIKADSDAYTISQALRETGYNSIAREISNHTSTMSSKMDTLNNNISGLATTVTNIQLDTQSIKADTSAVNTNTSTVASNTNSISTISSNVSTMKSDVSTIKTYEDTSQTKVTDLDNKFSNIYLTINSGGTTIPCIRTYGSTNGW